MSGEDRLVLRPPRWVGWAASVLGLILLAFVVLVAMRPSVARFVLAAVVLVAFVPHVALVTRRAEISPRGVRLAGRRRLEWDRVRELSVSGPDPVVVLEDGRRLPLPGRCSVGEVRSLVPPEVRVH